MQEQIAKKFSDFKWRKQNLQNDCSKNTDVIEFNNTQKFIKQFFVKKNQLKGMLLYHSVGAGKCHSIDTPILMHNGSIKKVQDIKVGEYLMGDDSIKRKVLSLGRGKDTMYDILPTKGEKFTINSEHILCLKHSGKGSISFLKNQPNKPYRVSLFNKDTIKIYNKSFKTKIEAEKYLNEHKNDDKIIEISVSNFLNLSKHLQQDLKLYRKSVEFKSKKVDFDPYIIGFWIGDGSKRDPVISTQDAKVIYYLKKTLPKYNLMLNYQSQYDYRISSIKPKKNNNRMLNVLKKENLINNKHIPDIYKINSREIRLQVLAGLIDSDGSYNEKRNIYEFTQKRENIIDDTIFLARSLGFAAYKKVKKTSWTYKGIKKFGTAYRINISGDIDQIPVKLTRKIARKRTQKKDVLVTGFKVEEKDIDKYYGFTIDRNNRYLMGDFTVTHNTCSGVLAASNFDSDYQIIWVTHHKLKNVVWKNIYDQSCHPKMRNYEVEQGKKLPKSAASRKRAFQKITGRRWIAPMTYKQFSNALEKKNKIGTELYARNKDPLYKTLVIVDEAHNLYNTELSTLQKPNLKIIEKMINNSYEKSKQNSVKVLLLSATPLLNDMIGFSRMMNLLIPEKKDKLLLDVKGILNLYFSKDFTSLSQHGNNKMKTIGKHISYLNLAKNRNIFAQPIDIIKRIKLTSNIKLLPLQNEIEELANDKTELKSINLKNIKLEIKKLDELIMLPTNIKLLMLHNTYSMFSKRDLRALVVEKEIVEGCVIGTTRGKAQCKKDYKPINRIAIASIKTDMKAYKRTTKANITAKIKANKKLIKSIPRAKTFENSYNKCSNLSRVTRSAGTRIETDVELYDRKLKCNKKTVLWSGKMGTNIKFDSSAFDSDIFNEKMTLDSPKLVELFKNITDIDTKDRKAGKPHGKHVIFTYGSGYDGAKLVISAFKAQQYNYQLSHRREIMANGKEKNTIWYPYSVPHNEKNFTALTGSSIYKASMKKKTVSKIIRKFNARPTNINGEKLRFIIIDRNFLEGIDLYDVKYFHILDPSLFSTELTQLIGRATRTCGQKGLQFDKKDGWQLKVFKYNGYLDDTNMDTKIKQKRIAQMNMSEKMLKAREMVSNSLVTQAIDKLITYSPTTNSSIKKSSKKPSIKKSPKKPSIKKSSIKKSPKKLSIKKKKVVAKKSTKKIISDLRRKDGRISAAAYYKIFGSIAIGTKCDIRNNGVFKKLHIHRTGRASWQPIQSDDNSTKCLVDEKE